MNDLAKYLNGVAVDEACNCGVDHGSDEKNIAPSVVEGDEKVERPAAPEVVSAQDAAAKEYLALCQDGIKFKPGFEPTDEQIVAELNKNRIGGVTPYRIRGGKIIGGVPLLKRNGDDGVRRHADGSVCKAQSPETCPFNKKAEAAETEITGKEKTDEEIRQHDTK